MSETWPDSLTPSLAALGLPPLHDVERGRRGASAPSGGEANQSSTSTVRELDAHSPQKIV